MKVVETGCRGVGGQDQGQKLSFEGSGFYYECLPLFSFYFSTVPKCLSRVYFIMEKNLVL